MAIILKAGVRIRGIQPEMMLAILVAEHEYESQGKPMVITSVMDGKHSEKSLHYQGLAIDIRTKTIPAESKRSVASAIQGALGECYEVFLEHEGKDNEHIHIELSPIGLEKVKR